MANRCEKASAGTAQGSLLSCADDRAVAALKRSREVRARGSRQLQAARERVAAARGRRRSTAGGRPGPAGPYLAARSDDLSQQIERARTSRVRLAEMAAALARTEETAAHIHDRLADRDPRRAAQFRRAADDARRAAHRAREFQRHAR